MSIYDTRAEDDLVAEGSATPEEMERFVARFRKIMAETAEGDKTRQPPTGQGDKA